MVSKSSPKGNGSELSHTDGGQKSCVSHLYMLIGLSLSVSQNSMACSLAVRLAGWLAGLLVDREVANWWVSE